jgi:hypothetical protein
MTADGKIGVNKASPTSALDVSGVIRASKYFHATNSASLASESLLQGCYIGWNNSATTGETNFINSRGSGTGGFNFIDMSSGVVNSNKTLMTITGFSDGGKVGIGISNPSSVLDVSGSARIGTVDSYLTMTPKWAGNGFWINIPTGGASGIGSGGAGSNAWLAYASGNANWFSNSLTGDICYRNRTGRLLFGTDMSNSGMMLSNNCLIFPTANTTGTYRLDVTGNARITGTLTTGAVSLTGSLTAPNLETGKLVITDTTTAATPTATSGSLIMKTSVVGGTASIVFPSSSNSSDYAFMYYISDAGMPAGEKGRFVIGIENDASQDELWITSSYTSNSGKIKLVGNVEATNDVTVANDMSVTNNLTVGNDMSVNNLTVGNDMSVTNNLTVGNDITATNNVYGKNIGIRSIQNFLNFQPLQPAGGVGADCLINKAINLKPTYMGAGIYKITFTNGKVPPDTFYSVSITGTWNNRADGNSGMVYSVCKKTTAHFTVTQKRDLSVEDGDTTVTNDGVMSIPFMEVTVSY